MKHQISLFAMVLMGSMSFSAIAYQTEIAISYSELTTEDDAKIVPDITESNTLLSATYYFSEVDETKGPKSVSAFLNRASSIFAVVGNGEIDIDSFSIVDLHLKLTRVLHLILTRLFGHIMA